MQWAPGARGATHLAVRLCCSREWKVCPPEPRPARPARHSPRRVFLALVEEVEDRGTVVAQGGGKVSWLRLLQDGP